MVDPAFDDFLDSDDDEFFLQASNHLLDNDFSLEYTSTRKESLSQNLPAVIAPTSNYFKPAAVPSAVKQDLNNCAESITVCEDVHKNASDTRVFTSSSNEYNSSKPCKDKAFRKFKDRDIFDVEAASEKFETSNNSAANIFKNVDENEPVATTSSGCNVYVRNINLSKVATPPNTSYINSRFTPGFTPKAKKRKDGLAGLLDFLERSKEATPNSPDIMFSVDVEFQNIVSSQYKPEHLSLSSWQKLQTTVSSCSNFHSTAKYYSIQRVLSESSKKKLPKHIVVPVLCVLLRKLGTKDSSVMSIFMDDTGEIKGKINDEVLSKYKDFLVEGTALILKQVTFLFTVLFLKEQNIVSLYHPEGTEKHLQSLEAVLVTSDPLKPMNCGCVKESNIKRSALKTSHCNASPNHHIVSTYATHSQNKANTILCRNSRKSLSLHNTSTPKTYNSGFSKPIQNRTNCEKNQNNSVNKSVTSLISTHNVSVVESSVDTQSMRSNESLEKLLDEENSMDEFDELLGNLDEKSFMEGL